MSMDPVSLKAFKPLLHRRADNVLPSSENFLLIEKKKKTPDARCFRIFVMAQEQKPARDQNISNPGVIHVEIKDRVPKIASRFEALAGGKEPPVEQSESAVASERSNFEKEREDRDRHERGNQNQRFESLAEKSKKEAKNEKPSAKVKLEREGEGEERDSGVGDISKYRQVAQQNSIDAIRAAEERYAEAKEKAAGTFQKARESAAPNLAAAKDTLTGAGQKAVEYVSPAAKQAKDVALEKGAAAKEASLESGKEAATYAGKVAADLKERAVVAGWGAAQYSTEKAIEGTKMAADVAKNVAGYAADKTVAAGQVAVDLAAKPVSAAKDAAAATGESVKEYAARKKEEAERELEARRAADAKAQSEGERKAEEEHGRAAGKGTELLSAVEATDGYEKSGPPPLERERVKGGGGVLGAIGETLVEIAQTTKDMVVRQDETRAGEEIEGGGGMRHVSEYGEDRAEGRNESRGRSGLEEKVQVMKL